MRQRVGPIVKVLVVMCLLACAAGSAAAQDESDLSARQRIFPGVGPGLRTIKRGADGRLYILASPSPGLLVFDAQGKQVLSINETGIASSGTGQRHALITFGEDCDGAAGGGYSARLRCRGGHSSRTEPGDCFRQKRKRR